MSTNISGEKRQALLAKIAEIKLFIEQNSNDKNASQLISYLGDLTREVNGKKYGLVFEEHREAIDEKLEQNAPILIDEKDLFIDNGGELNFLLEGDNLASLKLLEKTHRGNIDVIYIDPPYNTGNKDFIYDDDFVDSTDQFRHSKWLSFMEKRLKAAKSLLSDKGIIYISINNLELSGLKMLCDEILGSSNFISTLVWKCRSSLYYTDPLISDITEYVLLYAKKKDSFWLKSFDKDNIGDEKKLEGFFFNRIKKKYDGDNYSNPDNDPNGPFITSGKVRNDGRPSYTVISPTGVKHTQPWVYTPEVFEKLDKAGQIYWGIDGSAQPRKKSYLKDFIGNVSSNLLCDEFVRKEDEVGNIKKEKYFEIGTTESGTKEIKDIIKEVDFSYPKPSSLIKYLAFLYPKKSATILDFFAGSGTTGHAVLKLNAEDGGHRKFILCTNNENNICRDITYQRLKTVITGTRKDGSKYSDGLPGSLKYFKTDFIPISEKMYYEYADDLLLHVRELVELENAVNFDKDKTVAIVLDDDEMEEFIATLVESGRNEQKDTSTGLSVRNTGLSVRSTVLSVRALYVGHDVLVSGKQERILKSHNISINTIPDYYYRDLAL